MTDEAPQRPGIFMQPSLQGETITLTLTALQWDLLRYGCRAAARRLRKSAKSSAHDEYIQRLEHRAIEMDRVKTVISDALRRELGEQDFNALELAFENPRRRKEQETGNENGAR